MYFTQEQIDEIIQRVAVRGVKDTQLNTANDLTGEEIISVVQQGDNKQLSVDKFFDGWIAYEDRTGRVSIFNASVYAGSYSSPYTFNSIVEAVENLPLNIKRAGQLVTYLDTDTYWYTYQYIGTSIDTTAWTNPSNWKAANVVQTLGDDLSLPISQKGITDAYSELANAVLKVHPETVINNITFTVDGNDKNFITAYITETFQIPINLTFPQGTSSIEIVLPNTSWSTVPGPMDTSYTSFYADYSITSNKTFTARIVYQGVIYEKTIVASPVHPTIINGANKGLKVSSVGAYSSSFSGKLVAKTNGPITKIKVNGFPIRTTSTTSNGEYTYTSEDNFVGDTYLVELV